MLDGLSKSKGSGSRLFVSGDDFVERSQGTVIVRQKSNLIAAVHFKTQVLEQDVAWIIVCCQSFHLKDLVASFTQLLKNNGRIHTRRGLNLVDIDLVQHFFARGGLLTFRSIGRKTRDELLQFLALIFRLLVGRLALTQRELRALVPEAVVPGILLDAFEVNVRNVCTNGIEEVTVVAHDDHRISKVDQEVLQPRDGFQVQIIGRLIEDKDVGITKQGLREKYTYLFRTF